MTHRKLLRKVCGVGVCLCLLLSWVPTGAFAITEDGLCDHHPGHTEECGYTQGKCGYVCEECARPEEPMPISDGVLTEETAAVKVVSGDTTTYYASFDECLADMDSSHTLTILQDTTHDSNSGLLCKELIVNAGATLTLNTELYVIITSNKNTAISGSGTIAGNGTLSVAGDISDVTISSPVKVTQGAAGSIKSGTFTNTVTISSDKFSVQGGTFSGEVTVDAGQITGGNFWGTVTNSSSGSDNDGGIVGGTFHDAVNNKALINGGIFNDSVNNSCLIWNGTFNGTVTNDGTIQGGTFNNTVINHFDSNDAYSIFGGTFNGTLLNHGYIWPCYSITLGDNCTVTNYSTATFEDCPHTYRNGGICRLCGDGCGHTSYKDGFCDICGNECKHESWSDGKCTICQKACAHGSWTEGVCGICSYQCPHDKYENGVCALCGEPEIICSATITWGAMNFTYSDGTWNTETYVYDGAGWTAEGNTVTVENTGNVAVTATVSYQNETGYSFTASWDKETANIPASNKETFTLTLSGKPTAALDEKKVGTVTVTIGQADQTT